MQIDADFPGGNIIVESIDENVASLRQDDRTTAGGWFYWHFRVRGAAGQTVRFQFPNDLFAARGPCASWDGIDWRWLGREAVRDNAFSFIFPADRGEAFFSMGIPYVQSHLDRFLASRENVERGVLTRSEGGRDVELLRVRASRSVRAVLLTARTHACEAVANFAMEGAIDLWRSDPVLRETIDLWAVPFVDKDGAEAGDQGKNRTPHDHNRDYIDSPIYAVTRAIRQLMLDHRDEWLFGFDLHCPWIRGENNEDIYLVGPPAPWESKAIAFAKTFEATQQGELKFRPGGLMRHGEAWNKGLSATLSNALNRASPRIEFASSLELPYALASGVTVTASRARELGKDLARTVARHVRSAQGAA